MDWRVAQEGFIHSFLSSFCLFLLISAAATKERIKHTVTAAELRDKDTPLLASRHRDVRPFTFFIFLFIKGLYVSMWPAGLKRLVFLSLGNPTDFPEIPRISAMQASKSDWKHKRVSPWFLSRSYFLLDRDRHARDVSPDLKDRYPRPALTATADSRTSFLTLELAV